MGKAPGSSRPIRVGRYVLHGELAAGGMASVHFGRLLGPGGFSKSVAIKRLHRQFARDPTFSESILDEGRLAARIRHPNVVPPLDVLSEAGELLLVMEYVHGESLSKLLRGARKNDERVPLAIAAAILSNVLHGLHAAHEAKDERGRALDIVHRDVSPQNILVGVDGVARVIDFGIAKAVTTSESTSTGVIKGKVPYLAPEQLDGAPATRRTDVYAASVVLWEVLAGRRLFDGEDDGEILRKILGMNVAPPSAYDPSVFATVEDVVMRGLARSPARRFATAREMALALEQVVHLATSSVVGAWVERLAGPALAKRASELAAVEASDRALVSSRPPPTPTPPRRPPPAITGSFGSIDPNMTFSSQTVASPMAELSEPPDSQRIEVGPSGPASAKQAPTPPPADALRGPALAIANVDRLAVHAGTTPLAPAKPAEGGTARRLAGSFLLLLALAFVLLVALMPLILKSVIVSAAAERGIALSIARVEISRRALRLVDVRVRANDLSGVMLHATAVDVGLTRLTLSRLDVADVEIDLVGTHGEVASRFERYRAANQARLFDWARDVDAVTVSSGRIDWRDAFGPGSHALLENISFESDRRSGRKLGDDHRFSAPLVTLKSGAVAAGPWRLDGQRRAGITHATLKLDPTGTYSAMVDWTSTERGEITIDFAVPRVALSDVHLPAGILGAAAIGTTRIELHGRAQLGPPAPPPRKGRPIEGRLHFRANSIAAVAGATPVDVTLDLPLEGDASRRVVIDAATLSVSTTDGAATRTRQLATARMTGTLDATSTSVALDIAGESTPIPCSGKGETHVAARIAIPLSRIKDASLAFQSVPVCTPRLK